MHGCRQARSVAPVKGECLLLTKAAASEAADITQRLDAFRVNLAGAAAPVTYTMVAHVSKS